MGEVDFNKIAAKWQKKWEDKKIFKVIYKPGRILNLIVR